MDETFVPDHPGGWAFLRAGERVLAVPASVDVDRAREALRSADGVSAVLDLLVEGGVQSVPPFALVAEIDGVLRAVVRGEPTVESPDVVVSGGGVATWTERMLPVGEVGIVVPGGRWTFRLGAGDTSDSLTRAGAALAVDAASAAEDAAVTAEDAEVAAEDAAPTPLVVPPVAGPSGPDAESTLDPGGSGVPFLPGGAAIPDETDDDRPIHEFLFGPGDHDGATVMAPVGAGGSRSGDAPTVALPTTRLVLELPDGRLEPLDGTVVIGRAPTAVPSGGEIPRLVAIAVDDPDISRSHARIAVEGGTAVVTDLGSRNGTIVRIPGHPPRRLRDGEPTAVLPGTVIDFGGGVSATVRED